MNEQIKNTVEQIEGAKATDKATEPKQQKKKRNNNNNNNNNNEMVKELRVVLNEQDIKILEGIRKRNKNCCSLSASMVQAIRMYNQFLYQETKKQEQIEQMDKNIKELLELLKNKDITTDTVDTGTTGATETIEQATGTVEGVAEIGKIKKNKKIVINYKNSIKTTEKEQMNRRVNKDLLKKWSVLCKMNRHINSSELVNQALYEFIINHS